MDTVTETAPAVDATAAPKQGATSATILGGGGDAPPPAPEATGQPLAKAAAPDAGDAEFKWPDDWRDRLAGGDDRVRKRLDRYPTIADAIKALDHAQTRLSQREEISLDLPENATDEQKAEFRRRLGVPDKVEDYGVKPPVDNMSEGETALFGEFKSRMHELNLPPKQAQQLIDYYFDRQAAHEQAIQEAAHEKHRQWDAELRKEFGPDYKRNVTVAQEFAKNVLGEDGVKKLGDIQLADGTLLGNNPVILKLLANAGLATLDDDALVVAGQEFAGRDIDTEYRNLLDLQFTDPTRYRSPEVQSKLDRLIEARMRRDERNRR